MGWQTPESYLKRVRQVAPILFDPFSVSSNPTKAVYHFGHDLGQDSLQYAWSGLVANLLELGYSGLTFCNPPYGGELGKCVDKVIEEAAAGVEQILLVPSRTDTKWYNRTLRAATCTLSHSGRIQFLDAATGKPRESQDKKTGKMVKQSAAFPSVSFYFGPHREAFREAFGDLGTFVRVDD